MNKYLCLCGLVACAVSGLVATDVQAQDFAGSSYYCYGIDIRTGSLQSFELTFGTGDGGTAGSDNATSGSDNETSGGTTETIQGALTLSVPGRTFDNQTGTYRLNGTVYNGSWEGDEAVASSFYQETIYTYHSYLFFGLTSFNNFLVSGFAFVSITEQSNAKGTVQSSGTVPFIGVLVSASASSLPRSERKILHLHGCRR